MSLGTFNPFGPGGGGGGGVSPQDVQNMIDASMGTLATVASSGDYDDLIDKPVVDSSTSTTSTNAIQNKAITNFINSSIETATATFRGTYTTLETLNAAPGDKNDYAFYNHADAAGNTVFDRYKFVPTEQADLPEGYTQLEYIESSGTQYIDTGVPPTSKRRLYIKFNPLNYVYATVFFGLTGFSSRGYQDRFMLSTDNLNGKFTVDGHATTIPLNFPGVNEFEYNYPSITVNGDVSSIADPDTWYYSTGSNIYLFAQRQDPIAKADGYSSMRLHACKIYDTDGVTLIRDFIPCKNASNAIGLYDLINGVFYPNNGTGSFIAGPQANGYWEYEYTLNNSSFTADQWAAINSGITSSDKTQIATNTNDISSLNTNKLDKTGTAAKATADSAGNNIITTYAKKTDLNDLICTYRGTYTTAEALNAASGDKNDFAFLKTTDSTGNEIYSRYSRVEIPQVVPEGYTQLMYISSNGTQYIDTGVQAKRDLKSYIKFTRNSGGSNQFFGIHDNGLYYALWFSDWRWQLWCGIGSNYIDISSASSGVTEYLLEYPTVTVNDTVFNFSTQADFTSEKTIYLCAVNGESYKSIIDLYECIIYDDDKTTELKHFYPCKNSSNICGMYETVEGVFYPDANGGNFTAGPQANGYWNFEYSIPGNLFSSSQFAALDSGINSTKVGQIATNTSNIANNTTALGKDRAALVDLVNNGAKNILKNTATTTELNGVTFTVNPDGSVIATGTATSNADFTISNLDGYPTSGQYILSGCPEGGSVNTYRVQIYQVVGDFGSGAEFTSQDKLKVYIRISSGQTVNNLVFKPMICSKAEWEISHEYQPYAENNIKLTEKEQVNEAALVEIVDDGGKNVINITTPSGTDSAGITYTPNANKSFKAQGTASAQSQKRLFTIPAGEAQKYNGMILSGCPTGGSNSTYKLVFMRDGSPYTVYAADYGEGAVIQDVPAVACRVFLYIEQGQEVDMTFKPMICSKAEWNISHKYQPYRPSYPEFSEGIITPSSNDYDFYASGLESSIKRYGNICVVNVQFYLSRNVNIPTGYQYVTIGTVSGIPLPKAHMFSAATIVEGVGNSGTTQASISLETDGTLKLFTSTQNSWTVGVQTGIFAHFVYII